MTIPPIDVSAGQAAIERQRTLTKPTGALGMLEDLSVWCAQVQGHCPPRTFQQPALVIVAGDHGIAQTQGVSAYPPEVTGQMVLNFVAGGAAANVLARQHGVGVHVHDISVRPTPEYLKRVPDHVRIHHVVDGSQPIDREDAITRTDAQRALSAGREIAASLVESGVDLLIPGDMGIGNTTIAATIIGHFTHSAAERVTGHGTGIDDAHLALKQSVVATALRRIRSADPLEALAIGGGADVAALTGLILGAAQARLPILLDGVVSIAAAIAAQTMEPGVRAWCAAGHRSTEPAVTIGLEWLGLTPVLDLGMRLGEGSGALTALPVIQSAAVTLAHMATFDSAGVSDRDPHDA